MEVKLAMPYLIIGAIIGFSRHAAGNLFAKPHRLAFRHLRTGRNARPKAKA